MKSHLKLFTSLVFFLIFSASCVSQILKEKAPSFSNEISFEAPKKDFKKMGTIYPAWKSQKTGNVLSIVSDCSDESITSITNVYQLILDSVEKGQTTKQEQTKFQDKPATYFVTEGQLDGQNIVIYSLGFKRKNCAYLSSLSGRPDKIKLNEPDYNLLNESFRFE